jgi:hypothetical protein
MTSNEKIRRAIKGEHVDGVSYVLAIEIERMASTLRKVVKDDDVFFVAANAAELSREWDERYGLASTTPKGEDA